MACLGLRGLGRVGSKIVVTRKHEIQTWEVSFKDVSVV